MAQQRLILAIGRIERALSRLESSRLDKTNLEKPVSTTDPELQQKHERLKAEAQAAIHEIDKILAGSS